MKCGFTEQQLVRLIREELHVSSQHKLAEHVESCSDCQRELDRLINSDDFISVGSSLLSVGQSGEAADNSIDPLFVDQLLREGPISDQPMEDLGSINFENVAVPEQIGDYRIMREIGRGGMGIVYEAEQCSLGRRVALKVLPRLSHHSKDYRARFRQEAHAAAQMHHPNIVPVFEVGSEDGYFYYAMQLIRGSSLDVVLDLLRRVQSRSQGEIVDQNHTDQQCTNERPSVETLSTAAQTLYDHWEGGIGSGGQRRYFRSIAKIALKVAEALVYAHAQGVIHRDIKPSNLILDEEGTVWVTDFGLAKTEEHSMTETGNFLGTLRYLSPERFSGECDERTDVYALGITLYELLVQRPAFGQLDQLQLLEAIRHVDPPPPRSLDRRIPFDLETIVLKACEKRPLARYPTAFALAEDLQRFLNDQPIRARRKTLSSWVSLGARKWKRSSGLQIAAVLAIALLLSFFVPSKATQNTAPRTDNQVTDASQPSTSKKAARKRPPSQRDIKTASELFRRGAKLYFVDGGPFEFRRARNISQLSEPGADVVVADLTKVQRLEESVALLGELPKLRELWLRNATLTDSMFEVMAKFPALSTLELGGTTNLDDSKIDRFLVFPKLKELNVGGTEITLEGANRLMRAKPGIAVVWHERYKVR